jgi:hypothetical protein
MVIFELHTADTSYALHAELTDDGDLVVGGSDHSSWLAERIGRRDYEYGYTVKAKHVARLRALLGVDPRDDELLDAVRALLAPQGIAASTTWRAWLQANDVAWVFSVW